MKADLHNHTTASDGILNAIELAEYASKKGMDIIAITDHDSVEAFDCEIKKSSIPIIKGVELSTYCNKENIHLLGYFKNNEVPDEIKVILNYFQEKRKERLKLMLQKLKDIFDISLEYEDVEKYSIEGTIGRPHVAHAIEEKYNIPFREVFDRFIGNDQPAYVPTENIGLKEAIELLHNNNAIAVLAHPYLIKKNNVNDLISLGIDGIEVRYGKHTKEEEKRYYKLAKKNNLIVTGGSDFHKYKETSDDPDIGDGIIQDKELDIFLETLNIKIEE